jgi:hypothetical protein
MTHPFIGLPVISTGLTNGRFKALLAFSSPKRRIMIEQYRKLCQKAIKGGRFMSRKDAGHYATKHGPGVVVHPMLEDALLKRASKGNLSCTVAFEVIKELGASPGAVGQAADLLELRLVKCQLGLFGYHPEENIVKPAASVPPELEKAILAGLVNERLPCKTAWDIAEQRGIQKMTVSAACNAMGMKIKPCQLGAF